ncbi:MAG: hypothetical protein AAF581_07920 [Planctomycetota bacterium]
MPDQRVPDVSDADVERVALRDFGSDSLPTVLALLQSYGNETWHGAPARVRLAAMKLADGDIEELATMVKAASDDYRDVLAWAEYPQSCKTFAHELPADQRRRIYDADWQQYQRWLNGDPIG